MSGPPDSSSLEALGPDTLVAVLQAFPEACTLSRAVRDADGRVVDMTLVWMNPQARAGQPDPDAAIGRPCSALWPQMVENGSFAACLRVLDSGRPERGEFDWTDRDSYAGGYYDWTASRVGDDLLLWVLRDASERFRRTLESEARLNGILAAAPDAVIVIDETGRITLANDACERLLGWAAHEVVGQGLEMLMPAEDAAAHAGWLQRYLDTGERHVIGIGRDIRARHRDGRLVTARLSVSETTLFGRRVFTGMLHDLTERQQLEAQLRHAQKMEVVGRLVASVSHDFNNLLTIMTAASALLDPIVTGPPGHDLVREISEAAQRGAALTQQLLSLARPRQDAPARVDPAAMVRRLEPSAARLLGRDVDVVLALRAQGESVLVDAGALEQALLNLVVNARDAMPRGGRLTITVEAVDALDDPAGDVPPGEWLRIAVADTGVGMTPEVRARAIEPFFTTKPEGRGTGLGLSSVHDMTTAAGGVLRIDSTPGQGTTVALLLPAHHEAIGAAGGDAAVFRGTQRVLLVDDDPAILRLTEQALTAKGYRVSVASSAEAALALLDELPHLDIVVSDVVMPGLDGLSFATRLLAERPQLRVLLVSGFAPNFSPHSLPARAAFLAKPFTARQLAAKLQELVRMAVA